MKEQIGNWFRSNNNHSCDDQRFYDIVIKSFGNKIECQCFEEAIRDVNGSLSEKEIDNIYFKYETLYDFLAYYLGRN